MGKEMAESEGIKVEILTINDDVAVKDSHLHGRPPRRGRQLLRHQGRRRGRRAGRRARRADAHRQQGQRRHPHDGRRADRLHPARQGHRRCSSSARTRSRWASASTASRAASGRRSGRRTQIVDELLEAVVTDLPYTSGDRVALMVNGLGGTPISELYILYRRAHQQLAERGITVGRSYVNEYCTSLDMAGASLTLVRLDDEIESLLGRSRRGPRPRLLTVRPPARPRRHPWLGRSRSTRPTRSSRPARRRRTRSVSR